MDGKKCILNDNEYIVKLHIPFYSKYTFTISNKCRCSEAKVLEIQNIDGTKANIDEVYSWFDSTFKYKTGKYVVSKGFDGRYWIECSSGIHFYISREDACNFLIS